MKIKELQRYSSLYLSSNSMGGAQIFNSYFGFDKHRVVPLSVSHGVDFGQCCGPMDIYNCEPIHWSCNEEIYEQSRLVKPSILAPHPWIMYTARKTTPEGMGVLVIGPPPGPENDQALYELIKNDINDDWSILIKKRGNYAPSMVFWREKGLLPITAGGQDEHFYYRLYELLAGYKTILGCTFSSALVFSAAIGKEIQIIKNYTYRAYDIEGIETILNLESKKAKSIVGSFINQNQMEIQSVSGQLLGFDLQNNKDDIIHELETQITSLKSPLFLPDAHTLVTKPKVLLALALRKPGILKFDLKTLAKKFNPKVCEVTMNEFSIWENGPTAENFSITPTKYIKGKTEPGSAVVSY
jgi:hypothetical protein